MDGNRCDNCNCRDYVPLISEGLAKDDYCNQKHLWLGRVEACHITDKAERQNKVPEG